MSSKFYPTDPNKRIELLDVLRGVAIMGVIFSNILFFSGLIYTPYSTLEQMHMPELNKSLYMFIALTIRGKFYPILSILFGIGLFMQFKKSNNNGFRHYFIKRMGFLLLIGMVHQIIWPGDVVTVYALFAFLFIPLHKMKPRFYLYLTMVMAVLYFVIQFITTDNTDYSRWSAMFQYPGITSEQLINSIQNDGFSGMFLIVKSQFIYLWTVTRYIQIGPFVVLLFSLGAFLYGSGFITKQLHRTRYLIVFAVTGLCGSVLMNYLSYSFKLIDNLFLALAYMSVIALLMRTGFGYRLLRIFIPYGRMALTNYIMQSVILILIFYGIGLGYFGTLPLYMVILIGVAVLIAQLWFSWIWLNRHRFGPIEYIWRKLSYGKRL